MPVLLINRSPLVDLQHLLLGIAVMLAGTLPPSGASSFTVCVARGH